MRARLARKNGFEPGSGKTSAICHRLLMSIIETDTSGTLLKAVGKVKEIHPKKWKVDVDVFADEILCATGEVVGVVMPATFAQK